LRSELGFARIELRGPLDGARAGSEVAVIHQLDLAPDPGEVERGFTRMRRKNVRTAEKRGLTVERAQAERMTMSDLCARLFKDYQFGLSLIKKNTGRTQFVLDGAAIDAPDKFLSDLVVQSYYPAASTPARNASPEGTSSASAGDSSDSARHSDAGGQNA
jgi:hypothetical protein